MTADPSGAPDPEKPQTLSRYAYANNSPTNLVDPTGYKAEDPTFFDNLFLRISKTSIAQQLSSWFHSSGATGVDTRSESSSYRKLSQGVEDATTAEIRAEIRNTPAQLRKVGDAALTAFLIVPGPGEAGMSAESAYALASMGEARYGSEFILRMSLFREASTLARGDFGLGLASSAESIRLGKEFVGSGYRLGKNGNYLVSADGLKVFRPPSLKPNSQLATTGIQANFVRSEIKEGSKVQVSNGHLDIIK